MDARNLRSFVAIFGAWVAVCCSSALDRDAHAQMPIGYPSGYYSVAPVQTIQPQFQTVPMMARVPNGMARGGRPFAPGLQPGNAPRQFRNANAVRSANFVVSASSRDLAQEIAQAAEAFREELALKWLGETLPPWQQPCPIVAYVDPNMAASGETTFTLAGGGIGGWDMKVRGTRERVLDSVLPHEVTHSVLATHFAPLGRPVPRWADEGASTTIEHVSERSQHDSGLVEILRRGRGLPFAQMFSLKDYPADMMPLYAQGYSLTSFLLAQGGHRKFIQFLEQGMQSDDWVNAVDTHYGYPKIGKLQTAWNGWVRNGGGPIVAFTAESLGYTGVQLASNQPLSESSNLNPSPLNPSMTNRNNSAVRFASATAPQFQSPRLTSDPLSYGDQNIDRTPTGLSAVSRPAVATTAPSGDGQPNSWYRRKLVENQSDAGSSVDSNSRTGQAGALPRDGQQPPIGFSQIATTENPTSQNALPQYPVSGSQSSAIRSAAQTNGKAGPPTRYGMSRPQGMQGIATRR